MFEPIRGGTRGGQAEFKWSDVSADKDRENYLGHSINAPTGRWQKNKDIHWYGREKSQGDLERLEEIRKIKELEADALAVALGFEPAPKPAPKPAGSDVGLSPTISNAVKEVTADSQRASEKEAKRRRKQQRKEEKQARKDLKKLESGNKIGIDYSRDMERRRPTDRSRSLSPPRRSTERRDRHNYVPRRPRSRSGTPLNSELRAEKNIGGYNASQRDYDRERDRRRWDSRY